MNNDLIEALRAMDINLQDASSPIFSKTKVIRSPLNSYNRNPGVFSKPDYNFGNIQSAQQTDSYLGRAIEKKTHKFLLGGHEFSGENVRTVEYIKKRVRQIEITSKKPWKVLLQETAKDLFRYQNAMWLLVRDENNSGGKVYNKWGKQVKPIAGVFILPFEALKFKTKNNGEIERVRLDIPGARTNPEWPIEDIVHFYVNKNPGEAIATPILFSCLEDITVLRRIEENVLELLESNLFPLFHYTIGTDEHPELVNPKTGRREAEEMADVLEYMPSSGLYISDWRHKIEAIGSEGRALRIEGYLDYFKKRVFAALGMSATDFGEGDTSNKSTAQTQSKSLTESVEAVQILMKTFIDTYFINTLLMESSFLFDVLSEDNIVEINFNKIDVSEQMLMENNAKELYNSNAITHEELRKGIGKKPLKGEQEGSLIYNKFPNRAELARVAQIKAGSASSNTTANQHGTQRRKTSAQKDTYGILSNNLRDYLQDIKIAYLITDESFNKENLRIEFGERLYSLYSDALFFNKKLLPTEELYDNKFIIYAYTKSKTEELFNLIDRKVELSKLNSIKLGLLIDNLEWFIEDLEEILELSLNDNKIFMDKIKELNDEFRPR